MAAESPDAPAFFAGDRAKAKRNPFNSPWCLALDVCSRRVDTRLSEYLPSARSHTNDEHPNKRETKAGDTYMRLRRTRATTEATAKGEQTPRKPG